MDVVKVKYYTRDLVTQKKSCLFIFGDNLQKFGRGGQAIIRDLPNAYGIPTKKYPSQMENSFFSDDEYEVNISHIKQAIDTMSLEKYTHVVFPEDGLGTGLAELPKRAPKTYAFLVNYINQKFGTVY